MDDQVALLALSTLRQLNLRVPQDIRLASMYDDEALQECTPQITAVSFDAEQLGRRTAQQLLSLIRHQPVETRTLLGYQVGLRLSTRPERKVENYKSTARTRYDKPLCGQFFR